MRIIFGGTVQGVGFRPAVYRTAVSLKLRGRVWNNGSDVVVEIDNGDIFLKEFNKNLPPLAHIESVRTERCDIEDGIQDFSIVKSGSDSNGMSIPTDTAICAKCLKEIRGSDRRSSYPFTTCTDCGPRFTLLSGLPYDRSNTVMDEFPMCPFCNSEFSNPKNRRLHHQTICCPVCGPGYFLLDGRGNPVKGDPIRVFAKGLEDGKIGIAKSWGGMHICCITESIDYIREWYGRPYKPFAIMVRNMDSVNRYGIPTEEERKKLTSPHRPIVLIKKKHSKITEKIAPGMNTVGIFLPYSGMHHMLFDNMNADALIMTSANPPGEPMIIENRDAVRMEADMFLLHNQDILNRADDSVLRMFGDKTFFLRKSRGSIPSFADTVFEGDVVALGAQENLSGTVVRNGRMYPTQYIGNGENIDVPEYLEEAVRFNMKLTGCVPEKIITDLHPGYANRPLAKSLASEYGAEIMEVQHHWAHAASLMAEHRLENIMALTLDGTGHGDDGHAWGGEVLDASLECYKRISHLEYIPLLGSEKALYDLRRLRFAVDFINGTENNDFTETETNIMSKLMKTSVKTSSMGRFLDTIAYSLGLCSKRTYDGEPAMRLEKYLNEGKLVPGFETYSEGNVIKTCHLFDKMKKDEKPQNIAYSMVYGVMRELVSSAAERCDKNGTPNIGITGGVSYNIPICKMFDGLVKEFGYTPLFHDGIPNGDGGISAGQALIGLKAIE